MKQVIVVSGHIDYERTYHITTEDPLTEVDEESFFGEVYVRKGQILRRDQSKIKYLWKLILSIITRRKLQESFRAQLTDPGTKIAMRLSEIPSIDHLELKAHEIEVHLRKGFYWTGEDRTHDLVIEALTSILGWEKPSIMDVRTWMQQVKAENDIFFQNVREFASVEGLRGVFPDGPDDEDDFSVDNLSIGESIHYQDLSTLSGWQVRRYWPKCRVSAVPLPSISSFDQVDAFSLEAKTYFDKAGKQAIQILEKLLGIRGVYLVELETYAIDVGISPAYDSDLIHSQIVEAINNIYELEDY